MHTSRRDDAPIGERNPIIYAIGFEVLDKRGASFRRISRCENQISLWCGRRQRVAIAAPAAPAAMEPGGRAAGASCRTRGCR